MNKIIFNYDKTMDGIKATLKALLEPMKSFASVFSNFWVSVSVSIAVFLILLIICTLKNKSLFRAELKKTKTIVICAMMIAVNVVLEFFARDITNYIRISFAFVTLPIVSSLFGPIIGGTIGVLQDVAAYLAKPTGAFLINLSLNEGIAGMIFGLMLYNKKITLLRVFLSELIIIFFVNIILNSIALAPTVGSGLVGILPSRIIKNIILLPIQTILSYFILKFMKTKIIK